MVSPRAGTRTVSREGPLGIYRQGDIELISMNPYYSSLPTDSYTGHSLRSSVNSPENCIPAIARVGPGGQPGHQGIDTGSQEIAAFMHVYRGIAGSAPHGYQYITPPVGHPGTPGQLDTRIQAIAVPQG